jgi:type II secretion system protein N
MAQAEMAPPFGLTGARRVLAIAAAGVLMTSMFVVTGFPYELVTPRIEQAVSTLAGSPVRIGRVALGFAWLGPQLRAYDVDATLASGRRVEVDRLRVHPAWSLSWLRGAPSLVVALRSPEGEVDGTVTLGDAPAFRGELRQVALAVLPTDAVAPGLALDGRADATIDLALAPEGPSGTVSLDARDGSLTLPLLPIGVPFASLRGAVELGGEQLARVDALDLNGPLLALSVKGTVANAPTALLAPLALDARIEVRDPTVRTLITGQGVPLDADGAAEIQLGGTLADPQPVPKTPAGRTRGRAG